MLLLDLLLWVAWGFCAFCYLYFLCFWLKSQEISSSSPNLLSSASLSWKRTDVLLIHEMFMFFTWPNGSCLMYLGKLQSFESFELLDSFLFPFDACVVRRLLLQQVLEVVLEDICTWLKLARKFLRLRMPVSFTGLL